MQEIELINIEQLPSDDAVVGSKIMFGIGELLHTTTISQIATLINAEAEAPLNAIKLVDVFPHEDFNDDFAVDQLFAVKQAINFSLNEYYGGTITADAGQAICFRLLQSSFIEPEPGLLIPAILWRYYTLTSGELTFTGIDDPYLELRPDGTIQTEPDLFIDLGSIGASNVWEAFNADGDAPFTMTVSSFIKAVTNEGTKVWKWNGGEGLFGGIGTPAVAQDFILLNPSPVIGIPYLQAQTITDATRTLQAVDLNRTTTFTNAVTVTIPNSVFVDETATRQQAWLSFKSTGTINYPTTDGVGTLAVTAGALVYVERRNVGNEWIVKRVDRLTAEAVLGTLHNTVYGGVGGVFSTKELFATAIGVSPESISNFFIVATDVYAQINVKYALPSGFRSSMGSDSLITKILDYEGKITSISLLRFQTALVELYIPGAEGDLGRITNNSVTKLVANNITTANNEGLTGCNLLTFLEMRALKEINHTYPVLFGVLEALPKIALPSLTKIRLNSTSSQQAFIDINACTDIYFPMLEEISLNSGTKTLFTSSGTLLTRFYAPNLRVLQGDPTTFTALKHAGCVVTVHSDLATSNAGAENAIIAAIRAAGATIRYHQGLTAGMLTPTTLQEAYDAEVVPTEPITNLLGLNGDGDVVKGIELLNGLRFYDEANDSYINISAEDNQIVVKIEGLDNLELIRIEPGVLYLWNYDGFSANIISDALTETRVYFLPDKSGTIALLGATADTGVEIDFTTPKIFNSPASPATANITNDLTGALIGIVQKIYHNSATIPTVPAGWVLIGDKLIEDAYLTGYLNIIYAEWVSGTRVEYRIVSGSPIPLIVNPFKTRVIDDGGTFEAESCLITQIQELI